MQHLVEVVAEEQLHHVQQFCKVGWSEYAPTPTTNKSNCNSMKFTKYKLESNVNVVTCNMDNGPAISLTFFFAAPQSLLYMYPRAAEPQLYSAMRSQGLSSNVKYRSWTCLFVLSANKTTAIKYKRYALPYLEMVPLSAPLRRCEKVLTSFDSCPHVESYPPLDDPLFPLPVLTSKTPLL